MKKFLKSREKLTVNPTDITDFNRDNNQLEAFWLFCMFVAGKNSDYASRCLTKLIHAAKLGEDVGYDGVFNYFKSIGEVGIHNALVASKVGQYGRLTKGIMQSLDLDLGSCSLDDLLNIHEWVTKQHVSFCFIPDRVVTTQS